VRQRQQAKNVTEVMGTQPLKVTSKKCNKSYGNTHSH